MGVPKFFRYISERYPCLSELVREHQIPEFDNLYLDMNGIIHVCSHPNDADPHFRITEEQIFKDIFHYLEILFKLIKPRKLFFMAIDGVAPRAKMNQQRGRRFRSAKEAEVLEKRARDKGEQLPKEARFDSNCITPGTVFMARLHEQLKYFVTNKMSTDKNWQNVKVVLSGHETPGEGEHKIMEYIRWMRKQPNYDCNTRHCLYGLDADLVMLGLCTHEPHFSLLREEVKFGKQANRTTTVEKTRFYLLHLSLMREYLDLEFQSLKGKLSFPYDLESIIDDWVLMGFLVGNDFIPNLPDLHINSGALAMMYKVYMEVLPESDGYINEKGTLHLGRFQKFMEKLAAFDIDTFKSTYADLKYFEGKTGRKMNSKTFSKEMGTAWKDDELKGNKELQALIESTENFLLEGEEDDDDDEDCDEFEDAEDDEDEDLFETNAFEYSSDGDESNNFKQEFHQHKKDYYKNKLEYGKITSQVLRDQAEGYVRAIQWNLHYYYHGVASWSWYYPHHYAPYISDICNFKDVKLEFQLGKPFLPFEQLLAVLPAASKSLLPIPYQKLMVDEASPIIEYYPADFRTDLNGKKQDWEAIVLIPFIAEDRLLAAMNPCKQLLTDEENTRNNYGPMLVFTYTDVDQGEFKAPNYFNPVIHNHTTVKELGRDDLYVNSKDLIFGLLPGVKLDVYFPGFPTFKHLPYSGHLTKAKVQVFDQASREDNMILTLLNRPELLSLELSQIADEYLGKDVFCGWPHLVEGQVVAVSDGDKKFSILPSGKLVVDDLQEGNLALEWNAYRQSIAENYKRKQGVLIGETTVLAYVKIVEGRKYVFGHAGKVTQSKVYASVPTPFALQTIVKDIAVCDMSFTQFRTVAELFPVDSTCFLMAAPHYGSMGKVLDVATQQGRLKVKMTVTDEPPLDKVPTRCMDCRVYMPGGKAAQYAGIRSHLFSRITGAILVLSEERANGKSSKINIGLNLKNNKKNEQVTGYTFKDGGMWLYSPKVIELVKSYAEKFPEVVEHLSVSTKEDVYNCRELFEENSAQKLEELEKWIKNLPSNKAERRCCGSMVMEEKEINEIEKEIDKFYSSKQVAKQVSMLVKPHTLYKNALNCSGMAPDPTTTFEMYDRVINVDDSSSVPIGLKGTLIGIMRAEKLIDYTYFVLFDKEFESAFSISGSSKRCYEVSQSALINISHGERLDNQQTNSKHPGKKIINSAFASWRQNEWKEPPSRSADDRNWRSAPKMEQQGFKFPAPPVVSPKHRALLTNEQDLWNQLTKTPNQNPLASSEIPSSSISQKVMPNPKTQRSKDNVDKSQVLMKMLRISNENNDSEQISLRPQTRQISVDAIMRAAAATASSAEFPPAPRPPAVHNETSAGGLSQLQIASEKLLQSVRYQPPHKRQTGNANGGVGFAPQHQQYSPRQYQLRQPQPPQIPQQQQIQRQPQPMHFMQPPFRQQAPRFQLHQPGHQANHGQQFYQPRQPPFPRPLHPQMQHQLPFQNQPYQQRPPLLQHPPQNFHYQQTRHNQPPQFRPQEDYNKPQENSSKKPEDNKSFGGNKFIPLQAIKQQRNYPKSAALLRREHADRISAKESTKVEDPILNNTPEVLKSTIPIQQQSVVNGLKDGVPSSKELHECKANETESSHEKPRSVSRMRKSRLAVNFSGASNPTP